MAFDSRESVGLRREVETEYNSLQVEKISSPNWENETISLHTNSILHVSIYSALADTPPTLPGKETCSWKNQASENQRFNLYRLSSTLWCLALLRASSKGKDFSSLIVDDAEELTLVLEENAATGTGAFSRTSGRR